MYTPEELKTFEKLYKGKVIIYDTIPETIEKEKKFISFLNHKIKVSTEFINILQTFANKKI